MIGTIYALIPALLTIALVIFTRRVVLSLGIGAISAAFILANFNLIQTVETLGSTFSGLIFEKDGLIGFLNDWNLSIVFFLLALGAITAYIVLSGGVYKSDYQTRQNARRRSIYVCHFRNFNFCR